MSHLVRACYWMVEPHDAGRRPHPAVGGSAMISSTGRRSVGGRVSSWAADAEHDLRREGAAEHFVLQRLASGPDLQWLTERTVPQSLSGCLQQHALMASPAHSCDSWSSDDVPMTSSVASSGSMLYYSTRCPPKSRAASTVGETGRARLLLGIPSAPARSVQASSSRRSLAHRTARPPQPRKPLRERSCVRVVYHPQCSAALSVSWRLNASGIGHARKGLRSDLRRGICALKVASTRSVPEYDGSH
jgi:hypothetical protein